MLVDGRLGDLSFDEKAHLRDRMNNFPRRAMPAFHQTPIRSNKRGAPLQKGVNVQVLWDKLSEMEDRLSSGGKAYPDGMCAFPFRLRGQGIFPGGDGLWRCEGAESEQTSGALPQDGVMFLGNDFGTLESFQRLRTRGFENRPSRINSNSDTTE